MDRALAMIDTGRASFENINREMKMKHLVGLA